MAAIDFALRPSAPDFCGSPLTSTRLPRRSASSVCLSRYCRCSLRLSTLKTEAPWSWKRSASGFKSTECSHPALRPMYVSILEAPRHTWDGHPENPGRVRATVDYLKLKGLLDKQVRLSSFQPTLKLYTILPGQAVWSIHVCRSHRSIRKDSWWRVAPAYFICLQVSTGLSPKLYIQADVKLVVVTGHMRRPCCWGHGKEKPLRSSLLRSR